MIKCKAIEEKSLFVTATGHIVPCCYVGGVRLNPIMVKPNFEDLVDSWDSDSPFNVCKFTCDDQMTHFPINRANLEKQLK